MKRFFPLLVAILALHNFAFAQQCPDTSITGSGFHPGPDQLPPIERGIAYSQTVQINIPEGFDTVTPLGTFHVTIDSIHVNSITGQPAGITYSCTPSSCTFNGNTAGCLHFTGTTNDAAGQYDLTVNVTADVTIPIIGHQTQTLDMSQLGFTYYLTVVDSGALSVTLVPDPTAICAGETSTITATVGNGSGSETFLWSNNATTNPITVSPTISTTYTVTVTDGANTVVGSTAVIVNQLPNAEFAVVDSNMPTIKFTNTSVGTSYEWNFGDGSTGTDPSPTHTYTTNDTFTVQLITITTSCGRDTTTQDVIILGVGIKQVREDLKFSISPNPSEGIFNIKLSDNSGKTNNIKVYDLNGKTVYEETFSGSVQKQLNLSDLPKGVYTLRISSEKSQGEQKLVIR